MGLVAAPTCRQAPQLIGRYSEPAMTTQRESIEVAVVMRRERLTGEAARWQSWRWVLAEVLEDPAGLGTEPRRLLHGADEERWLHPGFVVELFADEAAGYYLNATTDAPCWFVKWRLEEAPGLAEEPVAVPQTVTLSYDEAGRWLDAQETVEQLPASAAVVEQLRDFVAAHYEPEPRKRKRPESFQTLEDRFGNPASISTDKLRRNDRSGGG